ncbi:MAG: glycosyltransferase family 2 protein, partial [Gemmatimonadales bacterium]|nr:glycosyltransferase family 2 protein [Gemmatimonadales bacterium]
MTPTPRLSVIMPAHQAAHLLPDTLAALCANTLPRSAWELIVVDDASRDNTAEVAGRWADRVIKLPAPPRGPGGARNEGADVATGDWLMFVDSDVRLHPDALARVAAVIDADPTLVAVFGSYDAHPEARGLVSEYRNLLHRYTHIVGAGEAETFWAGCGAVRRDAFRRVGGFDTARFPRPQIEDIDLGYRLRDLGGRILLDPRIQGTHLKRWTLSAMWRTDL